MPNVMNRAVQILSAVELTRFYGEEIEKAGLGQQAHADLVPELEKAVDLDKLNAFNDKCRKWIDNKQLNP